MTLGQTPVVVPLLVPLLPKLEAGWHGRGGRTRPQASLKTWLLVQTSRDAKPDGAAAWSTTPLHLPTVFAFLFSALSLHTDRFTKSKVGVIGDVPHGADARATNR